MTGISGFARLLSLRAMLTRALERILMVAVAALTLDVLWGVVSRYFLGEQSRWTEELARFLLVWVSLLGAAVAYGIKGHLGLDVLVQSMDPGARRVVRVAAHLLVLFFSISVFVVGGIRLTLDQLHTGPELPALGLSKGFEYLAAPISGFFFALYGVEFLIESLWGREEPGDPVAHLEKDRT